MTNIVKRSLRCLVLIALFLGLVPVAMMAAEGEGNITINDLMMTDTSTTINSVSTIHVSGNVTLNGTGDAFTINADTTLVFEEGATLTLTGYTNGFVVNGATLSGGGWVITDGDGMDLIRLKTGGKLNITGDIDLNGHDKTDTTSRGIVLQGGTNSAQQITLGNGVTVFANNFYCGMVTGGAENYIISGFETNSSTFDFSDNARGLAPYNGDKNATYKNCKLEVSNCSESGVYMQQMSAAINNLVLDHVYINCVNTDTMPSNIPVRFQVGPFHFSDTTINIQNAENTGLWIYDGHGGDAFRDGSTLNDCTIIVKEVGNGGPNDTSKAVTLAPRHNWYFNGCTFDMDDCGYGGINISCDAKRNGSKVQPSIYGGKITITDTVISGTNMDADESAVLGIQPGQSVIFEENVLINGDDSVDYTILCNDGTESVPYATEIFGFPIVLQLKYDLSTLPEQYKAANRMYVLGGSIRQVLASDAEYVQQSTPVNKAGEKLDQYAVSAQAWNTYANNNSITLIDSNGDSYTYKASRFESDGTRYIWAPTATVTFQAVDGTVLASVDVMRGAAFGLTGAIPDAPEGSVWHTEDGTSFTDATTINGDMVIIAS